MCERTVSRDDVDGRDEPGHDGEGRESLLPFRTELKPQWTASESPLTVATFSLNRNAAGASRESSR